MKIFQPSSSNRTVLRQVAFLTLTSRPCPPPPAGRRRRQTSSADPKHTRIAVGACVSPWGGAGVGWQPF